MEITGKRAILPPMNDTKTNGGQIVCVTTLAHEDGTPMRVPYVVAEPDPAKAEEIVRAFMTADEEVKAVGPVSEGVVAEFGLKPGEFTHS